MSHVFGPFVNAMKSTPRVALLPLIIWLGIGIPAKVGIIFLGAVSPMLINARDGVKDDTAKSSQRGAMLWLIGMAGF
jgi:ABC-type nitrate/sulfonate/bicarbonate transport system permease component